MGDEPSYVVDLTEVGHDDVARVGGKNASLGEMLRELTAVGIRVPSGFAVTAEAYRAFLAANDLEDELATRLEELREGGVELVEAGRSIRAALERGELPERLCDEIATAYAELDGREGGDADVAVRSSATAEDLPEASFAGQQETFLNIRGIEQVLDACRRCFVSLFTDRAIAYREEHGFDHLQVSLSVGVQRMVRSDLAGAGVMFSIDTDTGFPRTVLINAALGLGELVVAGAIDPDEYLVFKPLLDDESLTPIIARKRGGKERRMVYGSSTDEPTRVEQVGDEERAAFVLSDDEVLQLARWAVALEEHYGRPVDVEWAKDGESGELFVVQARPETVHSQRAGAALTSYRLTGEGRRLVAGLAVGDAIGVGRACTMTSVEEAERFEDGAVLVTEMTDPDWLPVMKRAAAIVTEHGGRTSHAAIVSRELGLPAVVGAHGATSALPDGAEVTVSCAEGEEGYVYDGALDFEMHDIDVDALPSTDTRVMLNLADPSVALRWWQLPADGVGLARMEFIIDNDVKVHPMALARFDELEDEDARSAIAELTRGFDDKREYFVQTLAEGIARIAASRHPAPVVLRMSDFKTNEYAELIGGRQFEPDEENPMLGWRGASRYYSDGYRDGFALECAAVRRVRARMGLRNLVVMIPFCRTVDEADRVLEALADNGLERGDDGLEVYVMAEVPSNVVLADLFAERFDGFSIGSNDLTQLVLGIDRDNEALAEQFDESDPAVRRLIGGLIETAHDHDRKVGLCGQKPSDDASFARFLVQAGIDSISVTPDSFTAVKEAIAAAERKRTASAP